MRPNRRPFCIHSGPREITATTPRLVPSSRCSFLRIPRRLVASPLLSSRFSRRRVALRALLAEPVSRDNPRSNWDIPRSSCVNFNTNCPYQIRRGNKERGNERIDIAFKFEKECIFETFVGACRRYSVYLPRYYKDWEEI